MRASRLILVSTLLVSTAFSTTAPARPRIPGIFGAVLGGMVGGVLGMRHYHHYVGRYRGAPHVAAATPNDQRSDAEQPATTASIGGQIALPGPLYWPNLADDVVDYVFWPSGNDDRFWSFGYGDVVDGALRPPGREQTARRGRTGTTTASGTDLAAGPCAGQPAGQSADALISRIEDTIQPTDTQKPLIAELRDAAQHGLDYIDTACPADRPQTPTARLDAMEDRLWAARQTLLITRAPLQKFYDSLSDDQKAKLDGPTAQADAREATCVQATPELPLAALGRGGRPTPEQRAGLDALRTTSGGLGKMVAASCPSALPKTPVERLDLADKRLNSLLYSVVTLRAPLDAFASAASDAAKTHTRATR